MVTKMQLPAQSDVPDTRRKRRPTFQLFIYENPCIQYHYSIQRQRDMQSPARLPGRQLHQYNKFAALIPDVRHIIDIKKQCSSPCTGYREAGVLACAFNRMDADALLRCLKHTFITGAEIGAW